MNDPDPSKDRAAEAAASLVADGMTVGLGSGTTASLVLHHLADRIRRERIGLIGVATSEATASLARSLGIRLIELDDANALDLVIDGADEVDPGFRMIKGRGGALLREKIVATAARRRVIVIGPDKRVDRLGSKFPVPVEVGSFGIAHTDRYLRALGAETTLRRDSAGLPYLTDGGHRIIDCRFPSIDDAASLDRRLHEVVGVFETGLFIDLCDLLVVGHEDRVELIERPSGS